MPGRVNALDVFSQKTIQRAIFSEPRTWEEKWRPSMLVEILPSRTSSSLRNRHISLKRFPLSPRKAQRSLMLIAMWRSTKENADDT